MYAAGSASLLLSLNFLDSSYVSKFVAMPTLRSLCVCTRWYHEYARRDMDNRKAQDTAIVK